MQIKLAANLNRIQETTTFFISIQNNSMRQHSFSAYNIHIIAKVFTRFRMSIPQ